MGSYTRIGIVLPAKDPGPSFEPHLASVLRHSTLRPGVEVVVVDDGSTGTGISGRVPIPASCLRHESNLGKGAALRTGFHHYLDSGFSDGDLIGFIDADGDIDASYVFTLADTIGSAAAAVGIPADSWSASPLRRLASIGFSTLVSVLMPTGVVRTQVGVKVFKAGFLRKYLGLCTQDGFLLDVELLAAAHHNGEEVVQIGVDFKTAASESTVRPRHVVQMAVGLSRLAVCTRRGRTLRITGR